MLGVDPPHTQFPYRGMKLAAVWLQLAQFVPAGPHLRGVAEAQAELVVQLAPGEVAPRWPTDASVQAALQRDPRPVKPVDLRPVLAGGDR